MSRVLNAVPACSALLVLAGAMATAQQPPVKHVKYKVSCATCAIELTPVATIGGRSDTVSIAANSSLDRDSQGRFFAIGDNFQVLVYDPRGRLLKTLGRRGDGPGEFNTRSRNPGGGIVDVVVGPGDSVFAFHPPKVTVFSPQLAYVRTISALPVAQVNSIHPLADGTWLLAGTSRSPEHIGRSVFIVDRDGMIRRSLGPEQTVIPGQARPRAVRFYAPPDRRSLWYAEEFRYFFSQWSVDGQPLGSLEIFDAPYLTGPKPVTRRSASGVTYQDHEGGTVRVTGIDSTGQLWIWGRASAAKPMEGLLEVVDPRSGEIRVSQRMTAPVWLLSGGNLVYSWTTDGDGFMSAVVSKYRLVRR